MNELDLNELARTRWLISNGRQLLAGSIDKLPSLAPWQRALLEEQQACRRRGRLRFPDAGQWLWTPTGLAQASDWWSARYKASLFPPHELVVDACCGVGVDLVALAQRGPTTGVDRDPIMVELAASNAAEHGLRVKVEKAELSGELSAAGLGDARYLHADPDRRLSGARTTRADLFSPSLESLLDMLEPLQGGMIKLAPATRYPDALQERIESATRVWLGNRGECRQQLWLTGGLAQDQPSRRAVLADSELSQPLVFHGPPDFAGLQLDTCATRPDRYVYDLHSVLHAAQLQAVWGEQHGLSPLGNAHGYYTGQVKLETPWAQGFEVLDFLAWDDRQVRKWLRAHRGGLVEVKCRSAKVDANAYQRRYSQPDGQSLTLLVTTLDRRVRCIVGRRFANIVESKPGLSANS